MSWFVNSKMRAGSFVVGLIALMVFTVGCSNSSSKTKVRFVNAAPAVVSINAVVDGNDLAPGIGDLGAASAYLTVASGSRHVQIEDATTSTVYIDDTPSLAGETSTTFLAAGQLNSTGNLTPLVLTDDNSAPASGSFKLRVINAAPTSGSIFGPVDVYVIPTGTIVGVGSTPTFSGLSFPSASSTYVSNTAGSFQVIFTQAGNVQLVYFTSIATTYNAGQVRTMLLVEDQAGTPTTTLLNDVN